MSSATHMQRLMLSMLKKSVQQKIQWLPVRYQLPIHSVCSLKQGIDICNCLQRKKKRLLILYLFFFHRRFCKERELYLHRTQVQQHIARKIQLQALIPLLDAYMQKQRTSRNRGTISADKPAKKGSARSSQNPLFKLKESQRLTFFSRDFVSIDMKQKL